MSIIENDDLIVEINPLGAALWSIKDKRTKREYLWQGDASIWGRRAPLLFPMCGAHPEGYTHNGIKYFLENHGFGRDQVFSEIEKGVFRLISNEATKKNYPFDFSLDIIYELKGRELTQSAKLFNTGKEAMPFSIGFHTGYNIKGDTNLMLNDDEINMTEEYLSVINNYPATTIKNFGLTNLVDVNAEGSTSLVIWAPKASNKTLVCLEPRTDIGDFGDKNKGYPFSSKLEVSDEFKLSQSIRFI